MFTVSTCNVCILQPFLNIIIIIIIRATCLQNLSVPRYVLLIFYVVGEVSLTQCTLNMLHLNIYALLDNL